jgi:hypothetical protein
MVRKEAQAVPRRYVALGKCPFALFSRVPDPSAWADRTAVVLAIPSAGRDAMPREIERLAAVA